MKLTLENNFIDNCKITIILHITEIVLNVYTIIFIVKTSMPNKWFSNSKKFQECHEWCNKPIVFCCTNPPGFVQGAHTNVFQIS